MSWRFVFGIDCSEAGGCEEGPRDGRVGGVVVQREREREGEGGSEREEERVREQAREGEGAKRYQERDGVEEPEFSGGEAHLF